MKSYKHIFFDWDGSLAMTLPFWFGSIKKAGEDYGLQLSERQVVSMIGNLHIGAVGLGVKEEDFKKFEAAIYAYFAQNMQDMQLYEGAAPLLRELKSEGKTLALISSGLRPNLLVMLKKTGIEDCFDLVISGSDVTHRKPHPEPLEKAFAHLGSQRDETIMIGDSEHDLNAAHAAGVDCALFYPDSHAFFYDLEHLRKSNPTYTMRTFADLRKLLL